MNKIGNEYRGTLEEMHNFEAKAGALSGNKALLRWTDTDSGDRYYYDTAKGLFVAEDARIAGVESITDTAGESVGGGAAGGFPTVTWTESWGVDISNVVADIETALGYTFDGSRWYRVSMLGADGGQYELVVDKSFTFRPAAGVTQSVGSQWAALGSENDPGLILAITSVRRILVTEEGALPLRLEAKSLWASAELVAEEIMEQITPLLNGFSTFACTAFFYINPNGYNPTVLAYDPQSTGWGTGFYDENNNVYDVPTLIAGDVYYITAITYRKTATPRVYRARVSQTGTNAPAAVTVFENTIDPNLIWEYDEPGYYFITSLDEKFGAGYANMFSSAVASASVAVTLIPQSPSSIQVIAQTTGMIQQAMDGLLVQAPFEILIYP